MIILINASCSEAKLSLNDGIHKEIAKQRLHAAVLGETSELQSLLTPVSQQRPSLEGEKDLRQLKGE